MVLLEISNRDDVLDVEVGDRGVLLPFLDSKSGPTFAKAEKERHVGRAELGRLGEMYRNVGML